MITEDELYERIHNLEITKYALEDENEMLKDEIEHLKEEIEYILQDRDDNYKPVEKSEQYDIYDNMFI